MTLPILSSTHNTILFYFYRFRYLTLKQVQTLFNHKSHTGILKWLSELIQLGVIDRHFKREFAGVPGTYFVTPLGVKVLRKIKGVNKKSLTKMKGDKDRSISFMKHCLFIVEIYIKYLKLAGDDKIQFLTQNEMGRDEFLPKHPFDAYIAIEEKGQPVRRYFLKVFDFTTPPYAISEMVRQYMDYATDGSWEAATKHQFPTYLFVSPSEKLKGFLYKYIKNNYEYEDISVFLSTWSIIKNSGVGKESWTKVKLLED